MLRALVRIGGCAVIFSALAGVGQTFGLTGDASSATSSSPVAGTVERVLAKVPIPNLEHVSSGVTAVPGMEQRSFRRAGEQLR